MSATTTYKFDCFVYCNGALQYNFADGYTDGTINGYHYYIRDHQGNNRVVAKYDGTIEQTTQNYFGSDIGKCQLDSPDDQRSILLGYHNYINYSKIKKYMKCSNKHIIRGFILLVFPILVYSCNNGAEPEPTIADILKNDSVELNNIIETLRNSNIDFMEFLMGRYECKNRDHYFPWGFGMYHREDSDSIGLVFWGQVIEWDSITLSAHNDYPDSTLLDTLKTLYIELYKYCYSIVYQ